MAGPGPQPSLSAGDPVFRPFAAFPRNHSPPIPHRPQPSPTAPHCFHNPAPHRASSAIWQQVEAAGDSYHGKYSGWSSVRPEAYYNEDETRLNDAGERVGPQGTPVEWVEEESYFFKLSAYQQKLLDLYARHPDFVLPKERLNEVVAFVKGGLQDLSISRTTFDWGVKGPGTPKHVMYVWFDALTIYIIAVGYPARPTPQFRPHSP